MKKLCLILMLGFIESTWEAHWTYDDESHWSGACSSGRQQSPINIISKSSSEDHACEVIRSPLTFRGYEKVPLSGSNNGHTSENSRLFPREEGRDQRLQPATIQLIIMNLEWKASPGSSATLSGGPLLDEYIFLQFHLHWISEHAIDGAKFPLELHLVHIKSNLPEGPAGNPNSYAVIGIPVEIREDCPEGDPFEDLMQDIPLILNNSVMLPPRDINVKLLLSPDPQSFYTYRGSLTTPNCAESVIWMVNDRPTFISGEKYKYIIDSKIGSRTNFRALQPINRRLVWKTVNSCAATQPSFLGVVGSLLYCAGQIVHKGISYFFDLRRRLLSKPDSSP